MSGLSTVRPELERELLIIAAEDAGARRDWAGVAAAVEQLRQIAPEPPAPVLPRMPRDMRRAARMARAILELPAEEPCAACGQPAEGNFAIHRDGYGIGPEVPLCNGCGGGEEPTCADLWAAIAARRGVS